MKRNKWRRPCRGKRRLNFCGESLVAGREGLIFVEKAFFREEKA
jgi:hypothetical protein